MSFGKLYTLPGGARTTVLEVVAKANNLDVELVDSFTGHIAPGHLDIHPLGKVPAFIGADGYSLHEVIAIAIYFASQNEKTTLLGKSKQDYASILKWMSFFNSDIISRLGGWYLPLLGRTPYVKKNVDEAIAATAKNISILEQHFATHTYLVGERITLADIFCASTIARGFEYFFDKKWRAENPGTSRWFETVVNQSIYTAVIDKFNFIDEPTLTNSPPKKDAKPAKAEKKVEAKPAAATADEEEEPAVQEPKAKHPCDLLPKASIPLDEWKRQYSNNNGPTAMKWFWENVKFDEYSLWRVKYKYNDELTLTFMSNNLIGGFNNRLEASRKHVFGCASVFGVSNDNIIEGAFVIRGQEYLPVFDVAPDYESYDFEKLDPSKPEDRAYVEDLWTDEKPITVNGKEYVYATGKVFK